MITGLRGEISPLFPLSGDSKPAPGHPEELNDQYGRSPAGEKVRILVVDDETLIADTVVEILNEAGFEAAGMSTGRAAIDLAKDWQPHIVLSDVIMPDFNGIEIGIRIREIVPSCRIILFSGQAATLDLLDSARKQGHTFDILAKPIKPEQLIDLIRSKSNLPS